MPAAAATSPTAASPLPLGLPRALWIAFAAAVATALAFPDTVVSIVDIWWRYDTFTHGFFVLPTFLWLVWRERQALAALPPASPDARALPLLAAAGLLWLLSRTAGILAGEQLALVLMIILVLHAFAGRDIARAIRFPLLFLLFLAPLGEEIVPQLMEITADLTAGAVALSGIPIYREGLFLSLPSGNWSVVEACSGIRYLIASITLGSLYAYLNYRSTGRRLAFIALAAAVPILANGVRAFLIVMIGHFSGMELATGVDHLIYGWIFFGIVMFVLFSIGSLLREPEDAPDPDEGDGGRDASTGVGVGVGVGGGGSSHAAPLGAGAYARHALIAGLCVAVWPWWASATSSVTADAHLDAATVAALLPGDDGASAGAETSSTARPPVSDWRPLIAGHDAAVETLIGEVPVLALAYAYASQSQRQGKEMISASNVLVPTRNSTWRRIGRTDVTLAPEGQSGASGTLARIVVEQTRLRSSTARSPDELLVWRWYRVGEVHTSESWRIKALETRERLLLRRTPSVAYVLAVDASADGAEAALRDAAARLVAMPEPIATTRR